jgi:hypothetical protein
MGMPYPVTSECKTLTNSASPTRFERVTSALGIHSADPNQSFLVGSGEPSEPLRPGAGPNGHGAVPVPHDEAPELAAARADVVAAEHRALHLLGRVADEELEVIEKVVPGLGFTERDRRALAVRLALLELGRADES